MAVSFRTANELYSVVKERRAARLYQRAVVRAECHKRAQPARNR